MDSDWGEPGLTPAERVFAWNSLEVLAFKTGNPEHPVNAIPPRATAHMQLRFVVGCDSREFIPALRAHLDARGFERVAVTPARMEVMQRRASIPIIHGCGAWRTRSPRRRDGRRRFSPISGGSLPNDCFADVLGLPTVWVPHSYPACSQHAPNEHMLASVARQGLEMMTGLFWDIGEAALSPCGRAPFTQRRMAVSSSGMARSSASRGREQWVEIRPLAVDPLTLRQLDVLAAVAEQCGNGLNLGVPGWCGNGNERDRRVGHAARTRSSVCWFTSSIPLKGSAQRSDIRADACTHGDRARPQKRCCGKSRRDAHHAADAATLHRGGVRARRSGRFVVIAPDGRGVVLAGRIHEERVDGARRESICAQTADDTIDLCLFVKTPCDDRGHVAAKGVSG